MGEVTAARAWLVLGVAVAVYELLADEHELLSSGVDRARASRPLTDAAITFGVVATAGHLLRVWPRAYDSLAQLSRLRPRR